jgi:hypothetical protein
MADDLYPASAAVKQLANFTAVAAVWIVVVRFSCSSAVPDTVLCARPSSVAASHCRKRRFRAILQLLQRRGRSCT